MDLVGFAHGGKRFATVMSRVCGQIWNWVGMNEFQESSDIVGYLHCCFSLTPNCKYGQAVFVLIESSKRLPHRNYRH